MNGNPAIFLSERDYSLALFGALCSAGIDPQQAIDCARNTAGPIAQLADVSVEVAITKRLSWQREHFGLVASEARINHAARTCGKLPRYVSP